MNPWEMLNIAVLELVAFLVKRALIDCRTGKLLPVEKRAIPVDKQERVLLLLKTISGLTVLRHKSKLKAKLLFLADILEGRVVHMPMHFVSSKIKRHQHN